MRPLIVGNWKMHGLSDQLGEIDAIASSRAVLKSNAEIVICPPDTLIERAKHVAAGRIAIGAQNCHSAISGAYTGDVSAEMLKDAGASLVIVGHSERRQQYAETDAIVAAKAAAAWRAGLIAIICVGETQTQRGNGDSSSVCAKQIAGCVPQGLTSSIDAIAYEPRWAIGTGHLPTTAQIVQMHSHIRRCLVARFGATPGNEIRIIYGGSVTADNAREILELPDVDGVLVGRDSLDSNDFEAITNACAAST